MVLPCDFMPPPDLDLSSVLDAYRMDTHEPILTSLLYERGEVVKDGKLFASSVYCLQGLTFPTGPPLFTIGLNEKAKTLLHIPVEEPGEDLQLRMSLMWM